MRSEIRAVCDEEEHRRIVEHLRSAGWLKWEALEEADRLMAHRKERREYHGLETNHDKNAARPAPEARSVVERTITGETVCGVPVLGWMWTKDVDGAPVQQTAYHWSTPPRNAKITRLVDAAAIAEANEKIASLSAKIAELERERDEARRMLFPYADKKEISGYSCNGIYLIGDKKSIKAAKAAFHYARQVEEYRSTLKERSEKMLDLIKRQDKEITSIKTYQRKVCEENERLLNSFIEKNQKIDRLEKEHYARMKSNE